MGKRGGAGPLQRQPSPSQARCGDTDVDGLHSEEGSLLRVETY